MWTFAIIALTVCISLIGFHNPVFRDKYLFSVREILAGKQFHRLITSAFLHANWTHLLMNMVSLYLFGPAIESVLGAGQFLLIYFASIIGGDLLSLWIHRHHEYRAYGASGGVSGLIFGYIILFPGSSISPFLLPVAVPAWLYAILYLVGSFLAIKRQADNVGHDAHVGGAIIGLWTTAALSPESAMMQWKLFLTLSGLAVALFIYLVKNPLFLPLSSFLPNWTTEPRGRKDAKAPRQSERDVDAVLEKISVSGIESLSPEEKALLSSVSEKYRRRADSKKPQSDLII
jgi:membrane associated rhomboid family serine protease